MNLDDPDTTIIRREIIKRKPFLRMIYEDWYREISLEIPDMQGQVLEIGSGAGFIDEHLPGVLTSDVLCLPGMSLVLDAHRLSFADLSLRAIVMTNVLHHLPAVSVFLREAARCVRPNGIIAMIEPWVTPWSKLIYTLLHHEPFSPMAREWEFSPVGALSAANGALAWIIFSRDRSRFQLEFPEWKLEKIKPEMPFRYLAGGGLSTRSMMPRWTYHYWCGIERRLHMFMGSLGMFALIVLRRCW
jgi:SAM-dependent methyltransferase